MKAIQELIDTLMLLAALDLAAQIAEEFECIEAEGYETPWEPENFGANTMQWFARPLAN